MPKQSTNPLPLYLRAAFHQAVADYWGCERGTAEPESAPVVWPTKALGWYAGFAAASRLLVPHRERFERIVAEWQEAFDLAEQ